MPRPTVEPLRRQQLINATMRAIDQWGLSNTTIIRIAQLAGVSSGIISHYFGGKDGLLEATMRHVLYELGQATANRRQAAGPAPLDQITAIIAANFDRSQIDTAVMKTWLEFWSSSLHRPELQRLQKINDRRLYANLAWQFQRELSRDTARAAARGLAAMIDGLWLRGALSSEGFSPALALQTASEYAAHWLRT